MLSNFTKILFLLTLIFGSTAQAVLIPLPYNEAPASVFDVLGISDTYRIGDEWGKKVVTNEDLNSNIHFKRMALATAKVGGGTGFYLGKFNGKHIMATNHHVCETSSDCLYTQVVFTALTQKFEIVEFFGSWPEIDLALFVINIETQQQETALLNVASNFAFNEDVVHGQQLVTIGYGTGSNPARRLVANQDSDCVTFSKTGEYRLMADPDDLNPGPYKAWSFANGCDVSHGDSGSAMMDKKSGKVIGIIWTGRIPKNPIVQSSSFLNGLLLNPTETIWKELSYGVPAIKMKEFLSNEIKAGKFSENNSKVLTNLLK
jgi:hypothetical protein